MKLKCTKEIVFINPSVNLNKVAILAENYGVKVSRSKTSGYLKPQGNRIVYKDEHNYNVFRFDIVSAVLPELFYKFKDNFFNRFFYKNFLKKYQIKSATEYLIKNRYPLAEPKGLSNEENVDISSLIHSEKIVLASYLTDRDIDGLKYNKVIAEFKLFDNLEKYLGNDYVIVKNQNVYIEFFIKDEYIYFIADDFDMIQHVLEKTFLKNLNIELTNRYRMMRNESTMIKKVKRNLYLINDFSFFSISLNPGKKWVETLGEYICAGKL